MNKEEFKTRLKHGPLITKLEGIRDEMLDLEGIKPTEEEYEAATDVIEAEDKHDKSTMHNAYNVLSHQDFMFDVSGEFGATVVQHLDKHIIFDTAEAMSQFLTTCLMKRSKQ